MSLLSGHMTPQRGTRRGQSKSLVSQRCGKEAQRVQGLSSARSFPSMHTFPKVSSVLGLVLGSEVTNMLNTWPPPL